VASVSLGFVARATPGEVTFDMSEAAARPSGTDPVARRAPGGAGRSAGDARPRAGDAPAPDGAGANGNGEAAGGAVPLTAVVDMAADRVATRLSASFTESADFGLRRFVRHNFAAVFDLFAADRDALTVLINAEQGVVGSSAAAPREMRKRVLTEITAFTRSRGEELGVDIGHAAELMALMFFRMAEVCARREADDGDWDREALIDLLTEFTLGGIARLWESTDTLVAVGRRTRPRRPAG
jgi:hypothetical protein